MESVILAAVIVLSPLVVAQLFRSNAGAMLLAGCGAFVLLGTLDPVLITTAGAVIPTEGEAIVRLLVIATTIGIATSIFSHTIHGSRVVINGIIALLLGFILLLQLPILTGLGPLVDLVREDWWKQLELYDSGIVLLGLGLSLLMVLTKGEKHKKPKKKH